MKPSSRFIALRLSRPGRPRLLRGPGGYSLIELLLSITIIAVLLGIMSMVGWRKFVMRAERTTCESHLKSLYEALSVYVLDHGSWPQMPEKQFDSMSGGENDYWKWWHETLKPYDIDQKIWMCPTDERERKVSTSKGDERDDYEGSYAPTHFDPGQEAPRQWQQPWVIERGDFHGEGNLMIMPDGKIEASPWMKF